MGKTTLVLGASTNPERYANMAMRKLRAHGHPVVAVGRREGQVEDLPIITAIPDGVRFDTVTIYLNAENQKVWERAVMALSPKRIIFNPGAENPELMRNAEAQGIEVVEGCTLVMLGTGQF